MKWFFLIAFLVHRHSIASQPLSSDDCCPCPPTDRITDNNSLSSNHVPSDCLCRIVDSDPASSIFRPTVKAAPSFTRQLGAKEEPKPLLNPEVGLASSVLETLREVTDQEYEEALARDLARSALRPIEPDVVAADTSASESKNIVNIIVGPKNELDMDTMSEASHNHETRCIHPMLGQENKQYQEQTKGKLFKQFPLSKPAIGLQKNVFDMDNSPSEVKESILPARNYVLDNIKIKTDLLKSKLFLNNDGLTQRVEPKISFDKVFYKPVIKLPGINLASPLEHLKQSKLFDFYISPSPLVTKENDSLYKNVYQNKNTELITSQKTLQGIKSEVDEVFSPKVNLPGSKVDEQPLKHSKSYSVQDYDGDDINADQSILKPVLTLNDDCDSKNYLLQLKTTIEENEYSNLNNLVPEEKSPDILDTIPAPSKLIGEERQVITNSDSQTEENCVADVHVKPNPESSAVYEDSKNDFRSNIVQLTDDIATNLSIDEDREGDKGIPEIECTTEDTKSEGSGTRVEILNVSKNNKGINILPNVPALKEGIINTFENLKKVNEKWQEKIKLNVQDALHQGKMNNIVMKEKVTSDLPYENIAKASNTQSNSLSTNDLQEMSDSILKSSSKIQESDSDVRSSFHNAFGNNREQSESIKCLNPSADLNSNDLKDKQISNDMNKKEFIEKTIDSQQPKINKDMSNIENIDKMSRCEIQQEKSNNEEIEMEVQASENKQKNTKIELNNSRYVKEDIEQPKDLNNIDKSVLQVNNFFDDVKFKLSNVVSKTNGNILSGFVDNTNNLDINSRKLKQDRALDLNKPLLSLNKIAVLSKNSPHTIESDGYRNKPFKSNLNAFKTRVAIPQSMDIKPILSFDESVKGIRPKSFNLHNIIPKILISSIRSQNSEESRSSGGERPLFKESDESNIFSESTVLSPNIYKNTLKSPESKKVSSSSPRDRYEDVKNVHKTLGNPLKSIPLENKNILKKNFDHDSLLEAMASKRNELNEKLQAINVDLNDRLSSLLPSFNSQSHSRTNSKSRSSVKNKQDVELLRRPPSSAISKTKLSSLSRQNNDYLSIFKPLQKSANIRPQLEDRNFLRRPTSAKAAFPPVLKSSFTANNNFKPGSRQDSNIISLTPAAPPRTLIPRLKVIQISKNVPSESANIPKVSLSPNHKRPIKLNIESGEQYTLASENIMSRASLADKTLLGMSSTDPSSTESGTRSDHKTPKQEAGKNLALSKLKEVLKSRSLKNTVQKPKFTSHEDITTETSKTTNAETEQTMKQNIQYNCNMVCTKVS